MKTINVDRTASKGVVMGKVFLVESENLLADTRILGQNSIGDEIQEYKVAVNKAKGDLEVLAKKDAIFGAHLELVKDDALHKEVIGKITEERKNVELALEETLVKYVGIFECMDDEYMRERAADIKDVGKRLMRALKGMEENVLSEIRENVIIVAKDLNPSDTAKMNLDYIMGFITQEGGITSHVSIMARNLNLPALVGVDGILSTIKPNDYVIMDAKAGIIIVNPDDKTKQSYKKVVEELKQREKELQSIGELPSVTKDGKQIKLYANAGNLQDIKNAVANHAEGIGLFRTEFLYMENSHFPTEEEQFDVYKQATELMGNKELIIRTLDIGGDKGLSYFDFGKEENPFLGYRAIRVCLDKQDIFKTQLRAILKASTFGNICIMYPMIISMEELDEANKLLALCKEELKQEGILYNEEVKVGMMIETPASVICAPEFAKKVDFFSIGTNDLTQYTLAVDRGNTRISELYNSFHPAVIRSIKDTIEAGHNEGIVVGMCGEFASDMKAVNVLLGLGLDEFSMSSGAIAEVKSKIRDLNFRDAEVLSYNVLGCTSTKEIMTLI